jgi:hypothetical protein
MRQLLVPHFWKKIIIGKNVGSEYIKNLKEAMVFMKEPNQLGDRCKGY